MANNLIQIKRTSVTGRLPNTTSSGNGSYIAAGELALNLTDGIMYSSNGSTIIPIGANNVNVNVTGNLTVSSIVANGSLGTSGYVLKSNGSAAYWGSDGADVGAANQILYRNSSNVLTTSSGLQYDGTSIKVNGNLESVYNNGDEGGEIFLSKPATGTSIAGTGVTIDIFQNKLRIFENGGNNRGAYIDITSAANGVASNLLTGGGGGSGTVTSVDSGSGLTGGPITGSGTLSVLANNGITANATGVFVNQAYNYSWSGTQTFSANISFTGNNINLVTNTGSVMFAGSSDTNWRIGRNTGGTTKFYYTNNSLDIIAANSNLEGIVFGFTGDTYLETGYAGTFTKNPIYVGNSTVNAVINSSSLTVGTDFIANSTGAYHTGTVNAAAFTTTNIIANTSGVYPASNSAGNQLGATTKRWTVYASTLATTGLMSALSSLNVTGTANVSSSINVGANVNLTTTDINVGNATVNTTINSTAFTGTANNASYLGGTIAAAYVQNTDSRTLSGNLVFSGANTTFSGTKVSVTGQLSAADVTISGNLIVTGTTTSINTTALDITDKNITLAKGSASGLAANGAGFTIDGVGSSFVYDDSQESFLSSLPIRIGTGITNSSLTSTSFSGTANNSLYLNGTSAASYVQNTDSRTLSGNLVFSGANVSFTGNTRIAGLIANGSIGIAGQLLASNGSAVYWTTDQTSGNISANAITTTTLSANAIAITSGTLTVGNSSVNTDIGNNYISVGNTSSYVNIYSSYIYFGNTTTNAIINSTTFTGTANNALYLGGAIASQYLKFNTSGSVSGNLSFSGTGLNVTQGGNLAITLTGALSLEAGSKLYVNNSLGTAGQVLTTDGGNTYWSTVSGSGEFTNGQSISVNNFVITGSLTANSSNGTSGQVLTSNGTAVYWSTVTGGAGGANVDAQYIWTNTHTFNANVTIAATSELIITNGAGIYANGSLGTTGQYLTSNGTSVYWSTASGGGATLTANNTDTVTYYIPMANTTSGSWSNAVISTTKMYFVPSTGTLNATIFNSLSDRKQKTNIETISEALDTVTKLRGVSFNWIDNNQPSMGVVAQEINDVLPALVHRSENGDMSVNYNGIIGVLIEAIKQLNEKIDKLENK